MLFRSPVRTSKGKRDTALARSGHVGLWAACARLGISACALILSVACASKGPMPESVFLSASDLQAVALSADEVNLSWTLNIANRGTKPVSLSDIRCVASLEGIDYRYEPATVSALLPPGGSVQLPCSVIAAMPAPQSVAMDAADWSEEHAIAPWSMHALTDISEGSKLRTLDCYAQSTAPRIGKPVFELVSIVISQDDIINTKLLLGLSIRNPNAFPISLSLFSYDLYGEKKHWASGKLSAASEIPAFGTRVVNLELVMNFTQMNRALLDQVLRMDRVNYRLSGSTSVDMQRIPPYTQAYDLSGSTTVQR